MLADRHSSKALLPAIALGGTGRAPRGASLISAPRQVQRQQVCHELVLTAVLFLQRV